MEKFKYIIFFFFVSINSMKATRGYNIILKDSSCTIDGITIGSSAINGVSYSNSVLSITKGGIFILSGSLNGQIKINTSGNVCLVLNGVKIKNINSNAIIVEKAYELDSSSFNYDNAKSLDVTKAGIKLIIVDGTENIINGAKSSDADGAIHTAVSMLVTGETKGDGVLYIIGSNEGIETEKHFFMNGGILIISSQDDSINAKNDNQCIVTISGGKLLINSGLGKEGDGVDSNGYILITGGEIISASKPGLDSGLVADKCIFIEGGSIFSVGSLIDYGCISSSQPTMYLIFYSNVAATSTVIVKDIDGNEIISYCANSANFITETNRRAYTAAVVSHPRFKVNNIYHIYMDGTQLGYTGNEDDQDETWGPGNNSGSFSGEIKTDFILGSSTTRFTGIRKAL